MTRQPYWDCFEASTVHDGRLALGLLNHLRHLVVKAIISLHDSGNPEYGDIFPVGLVKPVEKRLRGKNDRKSADVIRLDVDLDLPRSLSLSNLTPSIISSPRPYSSKGFRKIRRSKFFGLRFSRQSSCRKLQAKKTDCREFKKKDSIELD